MQLTFQSIITSADRLFITYFIRFQRPIRMYSCRLLLILSGSTQRIHILIYFILCTFQCIFSLRYIKVIERWPSPLPTIFFSRYNNATHNTHNIISHKCHNYIFYYNNSNVCLTYVCAMWETTFVSYKLTAATTTHLTTRRGRGVKS